MEQNEYQIGIVSIHSDDIHWQEDWVKAKTQEDAEELADKKGYYRNLRLRKL